jgi:hypothetical protein
MTNKMDSSETKVHMVRKMCDLIFNVIMLVV